MSRIEITKEHRKEKNREAKELISTKNNLNSRMKKKGRKKNLSDVAAANYIYLACTQDQ